MLRVHGVSDAGGVRANNEDCFTCLEDVQFCAVADGMGGHNAGEVAARIAVDTIVECLRDFHGPSDTWPFGLDPTLSETGNILRTAIHLANARVLDAATRSADYTGMGTTVVAAVVEGDRLIVAHVGDSRLYLLRDRHLQALTRDDSWATMILASDPTMDPAVVRHHPMRHALTNVVGIRKRINVHVTEQPLADQDVLLLTSDGIHGTLDDERIEALMGQSSDERELAGLLVAAALAGGSRDNCTALVARHVADKTAEVSCPSQGNCAA